ncbi:uncharacterized protein TRIREDRAFT_119860 [Trichoderma reesei QM6a]|uniref:Predicted protein n=2 Tax=Hypocrea jecorina TaxID=51453 RepID=G0R9G2_HYPJQ|nr:uncharacterized protein TRIREDRAFT_119860 [Trichoderma reesei QM6a]EGR52467.1 predicted protein [Trichoderma reesei QM6a]ETR98465.1 hypothetical protein M419DRAFT_133441 [Trichoderma reesei RUT C-30]
MANSGELNLKLLQGATPREQAVHLRHVLDSNPAAVSSLTSQLISLVATETLPPIVLCLWPTVANQPEVVVAVIRQGECVNARHSAIKHFYRHLRREQTFAKAWEAAGGAKGVAQLAAKLSASNVRLLLRLLGDTARAQGARKQRQRELEKLLELLWGQQHEDGEERAALDVRPLWEAYVKLLPACGPAFRVDWEEFKKRPTSRSCSSLFIEMDHEFFESHYDGKLGRNEITGDEFLDRAKPLLLHRTEYGLQVLERFLGSQDLLGVSPDTLLDVVIHPLGKRSLSRRRISDDTTFRFWRRVLTGLKERSAFQRSFDNFESHFNKIVARLVKVWNHSRARVEYTELLATLFSVLPEVMGNRLRLPDLLRSVGKVRRYQLLRLVLKHTAGNRVDIGDPASLEHSELDKLSFRWQTVIFFLLPAEEALALWEKVQRAGQDVGWDSGRNLGLFPLVSDRNDPERHGLADRHVMRALLLKQIRSSAVPAFSSVELDAMRAEARQDVSRRMKKATQGRSAEDRSEAALSALALCVAIGDLELYAETLLWARRFNKDPLTVKEVYGRQSLMTSEGQGLLAVLHEKMKDDELTVSVSELTNKIHSANTVLTILYETALMGVNEPSFYSWDWNCTFELIQRVACLRLDCANDFQDRTGMSDDSLYEAVWKPTSAMLEKMLSNLFGPLDTRFEPISPYDTLSTLRIAEPRKLRGHTIRFFNQLAEFQDSLWAEVRRRETPALVTADEIWPKGATLQQLSSYFGEATAYLPYAQARVETVVFMDPLKALQPIEVDEEAQLAIGTFVDSWPGALQLYIQVPGEEERKERTLKAWQQATVALSKSRMSPEEAERFWWPVFQGVDVRKSEVGIDEEADQRPRPSLPEVGLDESGMQPLEWNPDSEYDRISQPEKDKALTPTLLDVLLSRPTQDGMTSFTKAQSSIFGDVKPVIPGKPRPCSFWSSFFASTTPLSGRSADAYATAAILAVNMKDGFNPSLLKTPFPNAEAVRIPAVYLDQEFLEREADKNLCHQCLDVLDDLRRYTPAGLLVQLAESVFESIKRRPETEKPCSVFNRIIKSILDGKDPSLATPLIRRFVLENPDASSWHRLLLNSGSLEKLSPADAKGFLEGFTDAMLDQLQEQAERRADEDKEAADEAAPIKAPLVKITTVKMLAQLLRKSPVVDPSLAVDLNIRILKRASHVDIRTASLEGLTQAFTNSATSSVVKRRILDALCEYALPIASSANESRPSTDWDTLTPDSEVPEICEAGVGTDRVPRIMELILYADLAMEYLLLRTNPPEWLTAITQAVRDNKKLAYTNSGRHWAQMWNSDGDMLMKRLLGTICSYLKSVEEGMERGEITKRAGYQSMDSYLLEIAEGVLMQGQLTKFDAFMENTYSFDRNMPVWGRIVERINELRTPAWQADSNRKPAVLPDTLGLKIRMLNLPRWSLSTPEETRAAAARCVEGVVRLLEDIVADQRPYIRSYGTLRQALEAIEPKAELGIALAATTPALDDASVVTLVDYLRVELAAGLLDKSHIFKAGFGEPHEEDVVKRATEVVMKMSGSIVEEFRTLAAPLKVNIENTDGWDWWS